VKKPPVPARRPSSSSKPAARPSAKPATPLRPGAPKSVTQLASKAQQRAAAKDNPKLPRSERSARRQELRAARTQVRQQLGELRRFTKGSPLKRGIVYTSIGSVLALLALVLATIFTPMMSIDKIEIVGLHRLKLATVQNSVKSLIGHPLTTVDEGQIQQRLAQFSLIESFTTVSLPPHILQIYIRERQPIGLVSVGGTDYLYDPAGVQIGPAKSSGKYPYVLVKGNPAHSPNYREAVSVLLALPASLYPKVYSIQATSVDDVRIRLRGVNNTQILWGDSSKSLLKSKVLRALMNTVKRRQLVVFDVSSPTAPTVRFGSF